MPGSRDKLINEQQLDLIIQMLLKRLAAGGGGTPGVSEHNLLDGDVHPDTEVATPEADHVVEGKVSGETVVWGKGRRITASDDPPSDEDGENGDIHLEY